VRRTLLSLFSGIILCSTIYAQDGTDSSATTLFVYEEKNDKIDPWVNRFKDAFGSSSGNVEFFTSGEMKEKDLAKYSSVVIYGAVQAFNMKGPIRDWLKTNVDISGKKVYLVVTASRWFLKDYFNQLKAALAKKNANVVDAVSGATQKMSDEDKKKFAEDFVSTIKP
jgi:hypothetical protein